MVLTLPYAIAPDTRIASLGGEAPDREVHYWLIYCRSMQSSDWDRLAEPFSPQAITWRIVELAPDGQSARVRPELSTEAIAGRLDEVAGKAGWSLRYRVDDETIVSELEVDGAVRSALRKLGPGGPQEAAASALAEAAGLFGLRLPTGTSGDQWVDYDPEEGLALFPEPAAEPAQIAPARNESAVEAAAEQPKSEGQRAIDRLVERLREEGKGLDAARLLNEYGGYGRDPATARELYGKLRELLSRGAQTVGTGGGE